MQIVLLCLTGMFFSLGEGFISVHEGVDKALIASGIVKQLERDILSGDRMRFSAPDVEVQIAGDKTVADKSEPTKPDGYIEGLDNENKWAGRTESNKWVIFNRLDFKINDIVPVLITKSKGITLYGEISKKVKVA